MLPIVEELDGIDTDAGRAEWLLKLSDDSVLRGFDAVSERLLPVGFRLGVECLRVRRVTLHAVRTRNGDLPAAMAELLEQANSVLRAVAHGDVFNGATRQ